MNTYNRERINTNVTYRGTRCNGVTRGHRETLTVREGASVAHVKERANLHDTQRLISRNRALSEGRKLNETNR